MVTPRRAARSRGFRRLLPVSPVFWVSALAVVACLVAVAATWPRARSLLFPTGGGTSMAAAPASTKP